VPGWGSPGPARLPAPVAAGPAGFARSQVGADSAGGQALPAVAAAAGPAGSGRQRVAGWPAARRELPAAAVADPRGSARSRAAGRSVAQLVLPAAAVADPQGSARSRAARHSGALPVAGAADLPAPERRRAAGPAESVPAPARGAPDRAKSAPLEGGYEAPGWAAFAPRRAAERRGAAVVAEQAVRWRAPVGREGRWRPAGAAAGQAHLEPAHLEPGAGRAAACRLPEGRRLARGAFRRLWTAKESLAGSRRQKALQYKAVGNYVSFGSSPCG
jgi:hypothetical protein